MTEDDIRGLLREMRDEPVPPDSLVRVRLAVEQRTSRKSRTPWLVALAAAAVLAMFVVMFRPAANPVANPVKSPAVPAARIQRAPEAAQVQAAPVPVAARKIVPKKNNLRPRVAPKSEPVVVRIETEDPDIVILLIGD